MLFKMWFYRACIGLVLSSLFAGACAAPGSNSSTTSPSIALSPCSLIETGGQGQLDAKCGTLAVFENRAEQTGRKIDLNIMVVPAINRSPNPDPLFFIPGGPGEAAVESFAGIAPAFRRINQKRDIVLVDQRGTGKSHPLKCLTSDNSDSSLTAQAQLKAQLENCLIKADADPRFYTTSIAMDDLDEVRQALGYDKINLYGGSYGTRAALVYLRQYPQHVRAVILDGVAPPNWTIGPDIARNAQQALDIIFKRCTADKGCSQAFPKASAEFQNLLGSLAQKPVLLNFPDPTSGEPYSLTLTSEYFANTIFNMSYSPETASLLPLLIDVAYRRNDLSLIAAQGVSTSEQVSSAISDGMRFSVLCAEDEPYFNTDVPQTGYMGSSFMKTLQEICTTWPRGDIPANFKDPVSSNVPVLILSGEADPVTPPENGALAAQTLPNSLQIVTPGLGHINIYRGCVTDIATSFIDTASVKDLSIACVKSISPMPFFTSFAGPQP
jgi:pimeloyl-ACP methyl ester carboxylesterase